MINRNRQTASDMAALRLMIALARWETEYRPDQARVPGGRPDGGRFTDASSSGKGPKPAVQSTAAGEMQLALGGKPRQSAKVIDACHRAYDNDIGDCYFALGIQRGTANPGNRPLAVCFANAANRLAECISTGRVGQSRIPLMSGVTF